jgi:hypothetical protein
LTLRLLSSIDDCCADTMPPNRNATAAAAKTRLTQKVPMDTSPSQEKKRTREKGGK